MDGWMDGWRIVNDLSSKAISCSNGFFHACLYITWVLYNSPHCKFPINFGFWLHAGFNVTLLIMTKKILGVITVFCGHVHGKISQNFGTTLAKKKIHLKKHTPKQTYKNLLT
jgi:hypothetical protein